MASKFPVSTHNQLQVQPEEIKPLFKCSTTPKQEKDEQRPVVIAETDNVVVCCEHESQLKAMETLNLQLEKQVLVLEGVIATKQAKIEKIAYQLVKERNLKEQTEERLESLGQSVVRLHAEIGTIMQNISNGSIQNDDPYESATNVLNELSDELHKKFHECSENNAKIQEELLKMSEVVEKLEEHLTDSYDRESSDDEKHSLDSESEASIIEDVSDNDYVETKTDQKLNDLTSEWKYSCEMCLQRFVGVNSLKVHLKTVHNVVHNEASNSRQGHRKDGQTFAANRQLFAHQRKFRSTNNAQVQIEKKVQPAKTTIVKIGSDGNYHGKDSSNAHLGFFCVCGSKYKYNGSLLEHIHMLTDEWKFSCKICSQKFYGANYLRKHMIQTHKFRPGKYLPSFGCRRCGKLFRTMVQLKKHTRVDHRNGRVIASTSNNESKSSQGIFTQTTPPIPAPPEEVGDEDHDFVTSISAYADPARFHCTCQRSFSTRKLLSDHVRAKRHGKIFKCSLCSCGFESHNGLKRHVRIKHKVHYQQGRFGCKSCGSTFQLFRELMMHRLSTHYTYNV